MEVVVGKRNRTKTILMSLSREQTDAFGLQVEELIKTDLNYIVHHYIRKYKAAASETFGWTTDDLMQHIRLILWKGAATFDSSKKFKITTYLSTILYYQMGNFSKACQSKKNSNSKLYCPMVMYPYDDMIEHKTAEDWYNYTQSFAILMGHMTELEKKVLVSHLINGDSLGRMEKKFGVSRVELVVVIKNLKQKLSKHVEDD